MPDNNFDFRFAVRENQGDRPYQEDYGKVLSVRLGNGDDASEGVLAVLCDGMGGHVSGEVASKNAAEAFVKAFGTMNGAIGERLSKSLDASNAALSAAIQADPNLKGMGCTLVGVLADTSGLRWVSVGDSALLLYRNGSLHRLNEDHSLGALLDKQAAANVISREEAASSPRRRTLRSALTGGPVALREVHETPVKLKSGDWIVVASDGLETLNGNEIASIIRKSDAAGPTGLADHLLKAVIDRKSPNQDNITLIPIYVHDPDDLHSQPTQWVQRDQGEAAKSSSAGIFGRLVLALVALAALAAGAGFFFYKDGQLDLRSLGDVLMSGGQTPGNESKFGGDAASGRPEPYVNGPDVRGANVNQDRAAATPSDAKSSRAKPQPPESGGTKGNGTAASGATSQNGVPTAAPARRDATGAATPNGQGAPEQSAAPSTNTRGGNGLAAPDRKAGEAAAAPGDGLGSARNAPAPEPDGLTQTPPAGGPAAAKSGTPTGDKAGVGGRADQPL